MSVRSRQLAYLFDEGGEETMEAAVRGGKGLGLALLTKKGLPVPYGFTIPTGVCRAYLEHEALPKRLDWHLDRCLSLLEQRTGKRLGDPKNPLLLSVRSGAVESMPGMMSTMLNVGYTPRVHEGLIRIGGEVFADDCKRRFEESSKPLIGAALGYYDENCICGDCSRVRASLSGSESPRLQVKQALEAVFSSWNSDRATAYREAHGFPHWQGTAATVQEMVFGNMGDDSCTGVVFSRDVRTGAHGLYGEFLPNAQGEDVVSGTKTPRSMKALAAWNPQVYEELKTVVQTLDRDYDDIVDVEFTVERGKLFLLQCRKAKRSARAAATHAVHQVWSGAWGRRQAVEHVTSTQVRELTRASFHPKAWAEAVQNRLFATGLPASPGVTVGKAAFTSGQAEFLSNRGEKCILIRRDTSPNDLPGMLVAAAFVTAVGGETSHAAVVARGLNKPAVVGCSGLRIEEKLTKSATFNEVTISYGDTISVCGDTGHVVLGGVEVVKSDSHGEVANFLRWVEQFRAPPASGGSRIVIEHMERRESVNHMLFDFYLVDAMARAARGSPLATQADELRTRIHTDVAEFLACYLLVAVAGEIRHSSSYRSGFENNEEARVAYARLAREYKAVSSHKKETRRFAQLKAVEFLRDRPLSRPVDFLRLCATVFGHDSAWPGSYGGSRWAAIARATLRFLTGEINHTVFADHAFDLRHNSGCMFDKHPMVSARTSDHCIRDQLDLKKQTTSINELYFGMRRGKYETSPAVSALWTEGQKAGLWGSGKV